MLICAIYDIRVYGFYAFTTVLYQGWQFRWVQVDGTDTIETADDAFELRIGSSTLSVEAMNDQNHHGVVASNGLTALAVLLIAVSVYSFWCTCTF